MDNPMMLSPFPPSSSSDDDDDDNATQQLSNAQHLLYILLDSNLPTGGFVASSGLESYAKHGFLRPATGTTSAASAQGLVHYVQESVKNYGASTAPFVRDSWELVRSELQQDTEGDGDGEEEEEEGGQEGRRVEGMVEQVKRLDALYDAVTLNHVTRRSSTAQGIALLTLYTKAFAEPPMNSEKPPLAREKSSRRMVKERGTLVIERIKKLIRRGETAGHLSVCWGLMTSAAGLSLEKTTHLHLFLHIRSVLSAAVRLNIVGPYASTGLLYRSLRGCLEAEVQRALGPGVGTGLMDRGQLNEERGETAEPRSCLTAQRAGECEADWSWAEEAEQQVLRHLHIQQQQQLPHTQRAQHAQTDQGVHLAAAAAAATAGWTGPTMVWPLGEIIMARHDFQHTRIFNS
ncbi:hypothetical protein QFC21_004128 [Naganishia friedmannii]|uniref:Uncharacterized protein n=1 Tax=Naganishia friedmannii TaxID=89922 RepID=A0ACC2VIY8_9TREE|nr:hypothetical protein QFC21_004128 [Naganishia friedmannii]